MSYSDIPYNQNIVNLYFLLSLATLGVAIFYFGFDVNVTFKLWLTIGIGLFPLVLKFAAPRIPLPQAFSCAIVVLGINYLSDLMILYGSFVTWFFLGKAIDIACVYGFGFYWVNCEYIPSWANNR